MDKGHLVGGIIMIVIGVVLMLNAFYKWVFGGDRDPKDYNIMYALSPNLDPGIRAFLGVIGAILSLWGAYLVLQAVLP